MRKNFKNRTIVNLEKERDKRTIFRKAHNRENPYAQISKKVLRDSRLSAKAMGLMCYFLSLYDNWEISITELVKHFSDGEKSLRAGIKELMLVGYIELYQSREKNGFFSSTVFLIHEEPIEVQISHVSSGVHPYAQKRHAGYRHADNGGLINTEINKNRIKENNNKADTGELINLYKNPVTTIELGNTVNQGDNSSNDFLVTQPVENFTSLETQVPSPLVDLPRAVSTESNKMDVEPDGSVVVVSLMDRIKHLAVSKVLVESWLKKYGFNYVSEKIQLVETQKPSRNPAGFLNNAIAKDWKPALSNQLNTSQTKAKAIEYPTHNENVTWFNSLPNDEKYKYYQIALHTQWMFGEYLKNQKISVLDSNFSDNSFFKMLMSLIGRAS